ncbi:MAG: isocitrate lyase/phosphoenolpyruvate mutase family protein [Planctomycetota bacterium]
MTTTTTPGSRLRTLLDSARPVAAPGAFNALVARAVGQAGFQAAYVSGGATSVAAGVPDVGLLTLDHFARIIRQVAENAIGSDGSRIPVLADADTGFGEEEMVRRTVLEYAHAGAAGLHLEDQVFPKRCGHLDGKSCIPMDQMVSKVEWAAKAARDSADPDFVICARTDATQVEGLDAAIDRAAAYVEAGASMIFPEGQRSEADFATFAERLRSKTSRKVSMLANMTEFGKTPIIPLGRFGELGYDFVIFPVTTLRVAMGAVTRALAELRETGTVEGFLDGMQTREELYGSIGYTPGTPWEMPG